MTDPIADMLTRIRNALATSKETVSLPHSNLLEAIAHVMVEEEYLESVEVEDTEPRKTLTLGLKYRFNHPVIQKLERISKPGRRVYTQAKSLKPVLSGYGMLILSTNKGVMTDQTARKENVGGEIVCKVW